MLGPFCKRHFTATQFYPSYDDPTIFMCSQWQRDKTQPNLLYLTYRSLIAALFLVTWIMSMVKDTGGGRWPIFLTNWGYTICTIQALLSVGMLSAWVLTPYVKNMSNLKEKTLKIYPIYWVLYTIATPLAFGITFIYWTIIYDAKKMPFNAMNYFVHGNNSILMMIDLWMVSHPIRILHSLYPAILGLVYTCFSVIYYYAGGTGANKEQPRCIYKILDWDRPLSTTLTCIGVIVFLVCLHMLTFLITKVKVTLYERCCSKNQDALYMAESKTQNGYVNAGMSNDMV